METTDINQFKYSL